VAVLVDALVIRVMLVPSFMAIAGKWNWWPNVVPKRTAEPAPLKDEVGVSR
jgi:RND superfamily putative drug exporter